MKREEPNDNERPWVDVSGKDTAMGEDSVRNWNGPTVNVGDSDEPGTTSGGNGGQAPANNKYYSRYYGMLLEAYKAGRLEEKYKSERDELVNGMLNNMENWPPELRKIQKQKIKAIDQAYAEISDPGRTHICAGCGTNIAPLLAQYPNMKICPVCNKNIERIKTKEEEEKELYGRRQKLTQDYGTQQHQDPKKENDGITVVVNNNHGDVEDKNGIGKGIIAVLCIALAVGFAVWAGKDFSTVPGKNVPTATAQTDNSASLQAQLEAEKSAREQAEAAKERQELSIQADKKYDAKEYSDALKLYLEAYEKGYRGDENRIGYMYDNGQGVAQDYAEAVKWYRKAAEQGNASGQFNLGLMYDEGLGVDKNHAEAVKWYRKAAEQGLASAQFNLGLMYKNGQGVKKNYAEAVKWYKKAAEQGDANGQLNLGVMYYNGYGVIKNEAEAIKLYEQSAAQGNETAKNNLKILRQARKQAAQQSEAQSLHNQAVQQEEDNEEEALKLYIAAYNKGYRGDEYKIAEMYYYGDGTEKDEKESSKWYIKAANNGSADAQYKLGDMYYMGWGVSKDDKESCKWYRKAAVQGHAEAQNGLGGCYDFKGVYEDKAEAAKWYLKAAQSGVADAQRKLGDAYYFGFGVNENYYEAVKWYRKAADQGDVIAIVGLARMYEKGLGGLPQSNSEAIRLYKKANAQNPGIADKDLKRVRGY